VQLLTHLASVQLPYHQLVFSGGTALSKSAIKTFRMSEDVDLKLVPKPNFADVDSRNSRRNVRKAAKQAIESLILESKTFVLEKPADVLDEYRYMLFEIRYLQEHRQAPCLRPYIKLELIESQLLCSAEPRNIQSIYAQVLSLSAEVDNFSCAAIIETQAEKLLSMMRRTASVARNSERNDDESLIRHIYDTYHIQRAQPSNIEQLGALITQAIRTDIERYGSQHPQMVESPIQELRFGLSLLTDDPKFMQRYTDYVSPMVYASTSVQWPEALATFVQLSNAVLDYAEHKFISVKIEPPQS